MVEIKFKRLYDGVEKPVQANEDDVGYDVAAISECVIKPFETKLIKTGISVEIPSGYEIQVRSRSGMALKQSMFVLNSPGTIDENYRGEMAVIIVNHSGHDVEIKKGQKVAQFVFSMVPNVQIVEGIIDLKYTSDRGGGFGSSSIY